jgi:hypothetical protein
MSPVPYEIDRNGRYFECILDFYRTGVVVIANDLPRAAIREEIRYFGLPATEDSIFEHDAMWGK